MRYRLEMLSRVLEVEITQKSDGEGNWISIDGQIFDDKNLEDLPLEILYDDTKSEFGEFFSIKANSKLIDIYLRPLSSLLKKKNLSKDGEQPAFLDIFTSEGHLLAPMPGKIVNIKCQEGDIVSKGQLLVVFEAMKMENEIFSPVSGKIVRILIAEGSLVSLNQVMIEIATT